MPDSITRTTTTLGFILLLVLAIGYVGLAIAGIFVAMSSDELPIYAKVIIVVAMVGFGLLLFAVVRQRIIDYKTDKYKDVEI